VVKVVGDYSGWCLR